jgi:hypothetical protein
MQELLQNLGPAGTTCGCKWASWTTSPGSVGGHGYPAPGLMGRAGRQVAPSAKTGAKGTAHGRSFSVRISAGHEGVHLEWTMQVMVHHLAVAGGK